MFYKSIILFAMFGYIHVYGTITGTTYPIDTPFQRTFKAYCEEPFKVQPNAKITLYEWDILDNDHMADVKLTFKKDDMGNRYAIGKVYSKGDDDGFLEKDLELFYLFENFCHQGQKQKVENVFKDDYDMTPMYKCSNYDACVKYAKKYSIDFEE